MSLLDAAVSALAQLLVLGGVPLLGYVVYHRRRRQRTYAEILARAGLRGCAWRYLFYSLAFALVVVASIAIWPPPLESFTRQGSAQRQFVGLGLSPRATALAFLYGVVQTGFTEELLFRGLIAGSLSRRLSVAWANVLQAMIFLLPHVLILFVMPEMWGLLPVVFVGALVFGWVRIKSGSILGPWLMHAAANVAVALSVAMHSAP
jgi:membrane protease YdiL (CAAX protease family)